MKLKPTLRNLFIAASTLAVSSFPLHAATIDLDLTTNNPGSITLDPGSNTFSYTSFGINYLIVGGGGAGGTTSSGTSTDAGGGGGAGGLLTGATNIAGASTITVGAGGAVNTSNGGKGGDGGNSSAFSLTAIGGGGGGWAGQAPGSGGSGGGAGSRGSADGGIGGLGEAGQGNNGGSRAFTGTRGGASGGGAGGAGNDNTATTTGANGGLGFSSGITGVATTYAAGGGGGSGGTGAPGGTSDTGGNGGNHAEAGSAATANTGGGGGGGAGTNRNNGGAGGSGIVVVSYTGPQVLTGGLVSTVGGDTVHQFTSIGDSIMGFNATIAGNIDGPGDLDWNGGGTLTLSGTNTYLGATSVAFGNTLILNGDNSGATGAIDVAGTIAFGPSFDNTNIPAALGRVVTSSTGTIAVDNHANFNFDFDTLGLTAAYLGAVGDSSHTGTLTPQGTTYRLGGGGGTLTMANVNAITGANSLIVREEVVLPVANNHDGGTTLSAGSTLTLGNNDSLGSGTLTIAGDSTIRATGTVNAPNPVSADANFTVAGDGALTLGGTTTINANRTINNINTTNPTVLVDVSRDGTNNRNLTLEGTGTTRVPGNIALGTGVVSVNGGTFIVNGTSATGDFNINNTATLGGTGTIGSNLNLSMNANIAPGEGVGTLSVDGDFNLFSFGTGTGKLVFDLGPIAASDRINVTGQLDVGGLDAESGTLGLSDFTFTNAGGIQAGTYTLITSSDLLGFLDTSDLTGTVAGFDATLQLNGTNVELALAGEGGGTAYDTWAATNAPTGTPDDDFDGDGVPNAIEFVLGGDKDTNDLGKLPTATIDSGNMTFTFVRDQASIGGGTSTVIEVGTDLAIWPATYTVGADTASSSTGVSVTDNNDGTDTDTVILTIAQAPDDKKFARLKVTITP